MNVRKYISYSDLKKSVFTKNLKAFACPDGTLIKALEAEQIHNKLRLFYEHKDFVNAEYLTDRKYVPFYRNPPDLEIPPIYDEWLQIQQPTLLFGVGLGYGLKYLLEQSTIPKLFVYERDKSLLKAALILHDFAQQLSEERLVIVPQEDIFTIVDKGIEKTIPGHILFRENKIDYLTLSRMIKTGKISTKRAVIFSGTLFILDCAVTLFDQGWDVFVIDPDIMSTEKTHYLLDRLNPDIVIKINLLNKIEQFSQKRAIVEWEIDPIAFQIPPVESAESQNLFIFTHNPDRVSKYQEKGYSHFEYLPLCANPHKFYPRRLDPEARHQFGCDVSFVGSLMLKSQQSFLPKVLDILKKLSREENESWGNIHDWIINLISNPPVMSKNLNLIEELMSLLNSITPPRLLKKQKIYFLIISSIEEYLAYLWRKQVVLALVPMDIHIWGTKEWKTDFPENYRGSADHYLDLPQLYSASKVNLDISRIYQPNIITMRVFDVLACGGFVLADRNESLFELFIEDWDIVCYDTPEEATDKINYYLNHDSDRQTIAERGYDKVKKSHTFENRINYILNKTGLT